MTGWPFCLAEIALYAVFAGLVLWMALDARDRWKQLREHPDPAGQDDDAHDLDDGQEASAGRRKHDGANGDDAPPTAS